MRIIISDQAHKDIEEIFRYIAKDSLRYAKERVNNIYDKIENLKDYPYIGRYMTYLSHKKCRELIYKSYRIVYTVSEQEGVYIHFIVHSARNIKNIFNQYKF